MRARIERPRPLTMPAVTVCRKPYGLPIAMAICPTRSLRESPEPAPARDPARDLEHREIGIRIVADDFRAGDAPVGKRDLDRRRAAGDVAVREEIAVRGDQEAGARACRAARAATASVPRRADGRPPARHGPRPRPTDAEYASSSAASGIVRPDHVERAANARRSPSSVAVGARGIEEHADRYRAGARSFSSAADVRGASRPNGSADVGLRSHARDWRGSRTSRSSCA